MNTRHQQHKDNSSAGFTLVEMMMTLLIFGVVLGVIGNVFFTTQGLYGRTSTRANQQMSVRAGLTIMVEELRRAGADPEITGIVGLVRCTQDSVRVRAELNDTEILELTYITCTYDMHATMSRALKLEFDDVDERMVEVPAPKGSSYDVMSMVDED